RFEGSAPLAAFSERLAERAGDAVTEEQLAKNLQGKPPAQPPLVKFFALPFDDSALDEQKIDHDRFFSLEKLLPRLKAADPKNQNPYRLQVAVVATDNNVETGPVSTPSVTSYTFLVVSESELLSQIYQQQDELRELLEKVVKRLEDGRTGLNDGIAQLTT